MTTLAETGRNGTSESPRLEGCLPADRLSQDGAPQDGAPPDGARQDGAPDERAGAESAQEAPAARRSRSEGSPPTISATELHRILLSTHRLGARVRLRFVAALLALHRSRLHIALGFSSTVQYAGRFFGFGRSQTYESLRVAEALETLPASREACASGDLPWSTLREISRVATAETERAWIEFGARRTREEVRAEVQDALRKNRKLPRRDGYGLPRMRMRVAFELEPEEHAVVEQALARATERIGESLGGQRASPREAFLFLAARALEGGLLEAGSPGTELPETESPETELPEEGPAPEDDGGSSSAAHASQPSAAPPTAPSMVPRADPYTVLYRVCPTCRASHVATRDAFYEVPEEAVARVEGDAERVEIPLEAEIDPASAAVPRDPDTPRGAETPKERAATQEGTAPEGPSAAQAEGGPIEKDRPNSRAIVRRVRLRDGNVCSNPHCGRKGPLHAHHIRSRSEGGRTELYNEVLLCSACHSLAHLGLLEIRVHASGRIEWIPAVDGLRLDLEEERRELSEIPVVVAPAAGPPAAGPQAAELPRNELPSAGSQRGPSSSARPGPAAGESSEPVAVAAGGPVSGAGGAPVELAVEVAPGVAESTAVDSEPSEGSAAGSAPETPPDLAPFDERQAAEEFWGPIRALEILGYTKPQARAMITRSLNDFARAGRELDENEVLNHAIRAGRAARERARKRFCRT